MNVADESVKADIRAAVDVMRRGGVILYPTDTIWGLGCDARNGNAVKRVYEIKRRTDSKALITLVDSLPMLDATVEDVPEVAEQLIEAAVEPVTIIYDRGRNVAPELLADDGSLGVRVTGVQTCALPISFLGRPLPGVPWPSGFHFGQYQRRTGPARFCIDT